MEKECSSCLVVKSLDEFSKKKRSKDGHEYVCKACRRAYNKTHYANNADTYKVRSKAGRKKAIDWLAVYKNDLKCSICGESRAWCLDFHHTDPTKKEGSIAELTRNGSIGTLMREIDKCIVVCRNCHADIHYNEKVGQEA